MRDVTWYWKSEGIARTIGGAQVYRLFLPHLDKWIVTEVPLTVEALDDFVPEDYLEGFMPTEEKDLVSI